MAAPTAILPVGEVQAGSSFGPSNNGATAADYRQDDSHNERFEDERAYAQRQYSQKGAEESRLHVRHQQHGPQANLVMWGPQLPTWINANSETCSNQGMAEYRLVYNFDADQSESSVFLIRNYYI